ncbi:distal tail protein Dit [Sporosarcina psychrophila]|uniref:distal tail protein Dit n=1 Tax=Sporosarcina psychrophila TaxID=1476 RepID=UPI00078D35D0|nr:distal tail protein Dit [Sporosarcina psychrophila]AMQ06726.1 hypothetical protein AZE41_12725 [Sporosarcina psychrophila]
MSFEITVNGKELPVRVTDVEGRGPFSQEIIRQQRSGASGSYYQKRRTPERFLRVHFTIDTTGLTTTRNLVDEQLNRMLNLSGPTPIIFSDEPDRIYYGITEGEPYWGESVRRVKGILYFLCPDPHKYGVEKTMSLQYNVPVNNIGTVATSPIITVNFSAPSSSFIVNHQATDEMVSVRYNFVAGDILIIDLDKRKIVINGKINMTAYVWRSRPFSLAPGDNTFTMAPFNGVTATIKYKPRWL